MTMNYRNPTGELIPIGLVSSLQKAAVEPGIGAPHSTRFPTGNFFDQHFCRQAIDVNLHKVCTASISGRIAVLDAHPLN
jgi:hypothetical protein